MLKAARSAVLAVALAVGACADSGPPTTSVGLSTSTTSRTYEEISVFDATTECAPDAEDAQVQVVQAFVTAYNERDLQRLEELVRTEEIWDPAGVAHSGEILWTDVESWAEAGWDVDERFELVRLVSYGPSLGSDITLVRSNNVLAASGIDSLIIDFKVPSSGCTIKRLVGHVNPGVLSNCAFFDVYLDDLQAARDQEWPVPSICDA